MSEIKYPITVTGIDFEDNEPIKPPLFGGKTGDFVSIRPCAKQYEGKTYLGILIGEAPLNIGVEFDVKTGRLKVDRYSYNPAILIPSLGKIIYGAESWWGRIKTPDDLRKITDQDIENVWYVRALKKLVAEDAEEKSHEVGEVPPEG